MFGRKKQKIIRRIHLDFVKRETVGMKFGEEIEIWVDTTMNINIFKNKVESLAFQCSLSVVPEPVKQEDGVYILRLVKV